MSLIGKNPFVNEVLTSCSAEQLTSLSALINNLGSPTVIKLKELKNTDKGVKYASVFLDDFTLVHGLWIYTDTKCGLFAFQNGFDEMQAIRIDTVNKNYEYVYQHLSVTEFRSTLDDVANAGSGGGGDSSEWDNLVGIEDEREIVVKGYCSEVKSKCNQITIQDNNERTTKYQNYKEMVIMPESGLITFWDKKAGVYDKDWSIGTGLASGNHLENIYSNNVYAGNLGDRWGNFVDVSDLLVAGGGAIYKHDVTVESSDGRIFQFSYYSSSYEEIDDKWNLDGYILKNCSGVLYSDSTWANPKMAVIRAFDDFEGGGWVLYLMYDGVDFNEDYGEFTVDTLSEIVQTMSGN